MRATSPAPATAAPFAGNDPAAWDHFVTQHPYGHLLQLSSWEALKTTFGWQSARVCTGAPEADRAPRVAAGGLLLFQQRWGVRMAYVPRGPVVEWSDRTATHEVVSALRAESRRRRAAVLKVEPELPDTPANRALLADLGFRPSAQTVQPRSTIHVDLRGDADAILQRMKSKWRYNVRLADRKGVTIRPLVEADFPAFRSLVGETAERDVFDAHESAYYETAYRLLTPRHAVFLLAEFEGAPLAAIVVAAVGARAWYLWGASSNRERNRMPNHALQWAGMQWAAARGATCYDMWGIPDELGALAQGVNNGDGSGTPVDDLPVDVEQLPAHGLWGVFRFKQGFGGTVVRTVGAWDMPIHQPGYVAYNLGLRARAARQSLAEQRGLRTERAPDTRGGGASDSLARPVVDVGLWQSTLRQLPRPHVLQSWEWGEVKAASGWQAERLSLAHGRAAFQFLTRQPLWPLPVRTAYVPKGPVTNWCDRESVESTLHAIEAHARARQCIVVKIDPDVEEGTPEGKSLVETLQRRGWRFSTEQIQFKNTGVSQLAASEEALLAGMKSKWRYNVRLAEKRGICVREGGPSDLRQFYDLYAETGRRDGFLIRPYAYYELIWQRFMAAQADEANPAGGVLLLAEHAAEPQALAGLFLLRYGETAWYFHGASGERRRRDMPNHLLQWHALRWAKAHGCDRYDWWGAPTHPEDPNDSMQGVWAFKEGFGALLSRRVGAWDYPVYPSLYGAYERVVSLTITLLHRLHAVGRSGARAQEGSVEEAGLTTAAAEEPSAPTVEPP